MRGTEIAYGGPTCLGTSAALVELQNDLSPCTASFQGWAPGALGCDVFVCRFNSMDAPVSRNRPDLPHRISNLRGKGIAVASWPLKIVELQRPNETGSETHFVFNTVRPSTFGVSDRGRLSKRRA
eukprot:3030275-Rhodomonas_salina.2